MAEVTQYISPAASAEFIAKNSKHVKIKNEEVSKLALELISRFEAGDLKDFSYGDDGLHPTSQDLNAVNWLFVIDTLNFCFWSLSNAKKWTVNGHTGYYALTAALRRAIKNGCDITNPKVYSTITAEELKEIFKSDDGVTEIPLIDNRLQCLWEVGNKLLEKYDGNFENCIKLANKSAVSLLKIIVEDFPCFRDEGIFENKKVTFYKRAQILVSDIWACFDGKSWGEFNDIDSITMFADYRVPQVLVHYGVLEYDQEIINKMNKDQILDNDSREVIEIRGCSIHSVELISKDIRKKFEEGSTKMIENKLNPVLIDYYLWLYRRKYASELEYIPFHKVLCQYY